MTTDPAFEPVIDSPEAVSRGRRVALAVAAALIAIDVAVLLGYLARFGAEELPRLLVRLGLAILLAVLLYRGFAVARWIMLALLLIALLFGSWRLPGSREELAREWPMVVLLVAYILIGRTLLFSRSLGAFIRHQRSHQSPSAPDAA